MQPSSTLAHTRERPTTSSAPHKVPKRGQRKDVAIAACNRCRVKRKRCDAKRPSCSQCLQRGMNCVYVTKPDETRSEALRRQFDNLKDISQDVLELYHLLKSLPEAEAAGLLQHIRSEESPGTILSTLHGASIAHQQKLSNYRTCQAMLPPMNSNFEFELLARHCNAYPSLEALNMETVDLCLLDPILRNKLKPSMNRKSSLSSPIEGYNKNTINVSGRNVLSCQPDSIGANMAYIDERLCYLRISHWTNIDIENNFAASVISQYLTDDHPLLGLFDADLFLNDLIAINSSFCSPFLVQAILSWGCQGYTETNSRAARLSYDFYNEAISTWSYSMEKENINSVAALTLLSASCSCYGRDLESSIFIRESARLGEQLQLFNFVPLQCTNLQVLKFTRTEMRARAAVAWGTFIWHTLRAISFHHSSYIRVPPIFPIPGFGNQLLPSYMSDIFPAVCKFWLIVHELSWLYYPGRGDANPHLSLAVVEPIYHRLLEWSDNLSLPLVRQDSNPHHVVTMHIWFHIVVIDIFRPFENIEMQHEPRLRTFAAHPCVPSTVIAASIKQLKRLGYIYRSQFPSANTSILWQPALIYVANEILKDIGNTDAYFYFLLCIQGYRNLARSWRFAGGVAQGIMAIATRMGVLSSSEAREIMDGFQVAKDYGGPSLVVNSPRNNRSNDTCLQEKSETTINSFYVIDFDLAMTEPDAARVATLSENFKNLKMNQETEKEKTAPPFWTGDPQLLCYTLSEDTKHRMESESQGSSC